VRSYDRSTWGAAANLNSSPVPEVDVALAFGRRTWGAALGPRRRLPSGSGQCSKATLKQVTSWMPARQRMWGVDAPCWKEVTGPAGRQNSARDQDGIVHQCAKRMLVGTEGRDGR
jgi:hypothetical protein